MRALRSLVAFSVVMPLTLMAGSASAHVELVSPTPRLAGQAGGSQLKTKPCGQTANARTDKVTTFAPGQKVDVKIKEYVDHPGYFAVAFDPDGDNSFPFPIANPDKVNKDTDDPKTQFPINGTVLGLRTDKDKNCASESADKTCTISITIPNMTCQNCTLQVIQFMYDKLGDGQDDEYYYQCADIKIEGTPAGGGGSGGTGAGGSAGMPAGGNAGASTGGVNTGGSGTAGSGGTSSSTSGGAGAASGGASSAAGTPSTTGGSPSGAAGSTSSAGATTAGTAATGGSSSGPVVTPSEPDDGGCSVSRAPRGASSLSAIFGVALALLLRRRRAAA